MRTSKYSNRKVRTSDGIIHDSQKEANRWQELKLMEKAGLIKDLKRQVKFTLIPAQYTSLNGKRKLVERECYYKADFVYQEDGQTVVEDVKGMKTRDYIIKRKLMLYILHIKIKEI